MHRALIKPCNQARCTRIGSHCHTVICGEPIQTSSKNHGIRWEWGTKHAIGEGRKDGLTLLHIPDASIHTPLGSEVGGSWLCRKQEETKPATVAPYCHVHSVLFTTGNAPWPGPTVIPGQNYQKVRTIITIVDTFRWHNTGFDQPGPVQFNLINFASEFIWRSSPPQIDVKCGIFLYVLRRIERVIINKHLKTRRGGTSSRQNQSQTNTKPKPIKIIPTLQHKFSK